MQAIKIKTTIGPDRKLSILLPDDVSAGPAEVMVILNPLSGGVDLPAKGWTTGQAAETRSRLKSFEEDWNTPGMEAYDAL